MTAPARLRTRERATPIFDAVFVLAFSAMLCGGLLARSFGFGGSSLMEKRILAHFPPIPSSIREWKEYPGAVDRYCGDNFGFRDDLIAINSYLHYLLGVSSQPKVLVGRHGWLYYAGDGDWAFYRGANRLGPHEIKEWLDRMEERRKWLADRGIHFVILPAPIKETVYPEYLPYWLQRLKGQTITDQLVAAAGNRPELTVVDVRGRLRKQKDQVAVYKANDTHWTAEGAFVGYKAVMERIAPIVPGIRPLERGAVELHPTPPALAQRDLVLMLGIDRFMHVANEQYTPTRTHSIQTQYLTDRTGPETPQLITTGVGDARVFFVRDSFVWAMLPYFEDTFGSIVMRHVQDGSFPKEDIERYHPDVFVLEVQEAGLCVM